MGSLPFMKAKKILTELLRGGIEKADELLTSTSSTWAQHVGRFLINSFSAFSLSKK